MINDITNREDIRQLVNMFCKRIKANRTLGPLSASLLENWEHNTTMLTDYWNLSLSNTLGNSTEDCSFLQYEVASLVNNITETRHHVRMWLNLWVATVDDHFIGQAANLAKQNARAISSLLASNFDEEIILDTAC